MTSSSSMLTSSLRSLRPLVAGGNRGVLLNDVGGGGVRGFSRSSVSDKRRLTQYDRFVFQRDHMRFLPLTAEKKTQLRRRILEERHNGNRKVIQIEEQLRRTDYSGGSVKPNRRRVLTSKQGNKNFYKGYGAPGWAVGKKGRGGRFIMDKAKLSKYMFQVPSLEGFKLKPYVDATVPIPSAPPRPSSSSS